ncbi:hypothetical protein KP509_05G080300 [Ceratopteris richardii]|uniref:Uncharacterized protein n=1 Tax=Ceratopteris richardii TaxID=49495 RepID=A0A8T2US78_CERRI|nr:hypothetical protein KP509_05G080300 [Ceratopteris richardii]KAH7437608.1 hypothetical protein KP509_05G080300 [Ceratopteris richardii]
MDLHPSGLPNLVGPEGAPFPHPDYSHSLRYIPNNIASELPQSNVESLSMARSGLQPLSVRTSPPSPRSATGLHPLRLHTEGPKPGSPREHLPSPTLHLLTSGNTAKAGLPHQGSETSEILLTKVSIEGTETLPFHQSISSPQKDSGKH